MDKDTIIKLAREAGFWGVDAWFAANAENFARFAELATATAVQSQSGALHRIEQKLMQSGATAAPPANAGSAEYGLSIALAIVRQESAATGAQP